VRILVAETDLPLLAEMRQAFGSAALSRTDLAAWRLLLPPGCAILHTYASTEALAMAAWVVPSNDGGEEATVAAGLIQPSHDYALLDQDDRPVSPGEPGELVLRSRYVALGEWQGAGWSPGGCRLFPAAPAGASFVRATFCDYSRTECCACSDAPTGR
jgi:acyl-CoA synthetase (AMP-forming)/AMP-acid ligase II